MSISYGALLIIGLSLFAFGVLIKMIRKPCVYIDYLRELREYILFYHEDLYDEIGEMHMIEGINVVTDHFNLERVDADGIVQESCKEILKKIKKLRN